MVSRSCGLRESLVAWVVVWSLWLATTRTFHPTFSLAVIVTTSLVAVYAVASYLNHLVLIPRLWRPGRRGTYAAWLVATMCLLTAAALRVIRIAYVELWGPDPDPHGAYKHYAIDLVGMAVHVSAAAVVVRMARRWNEARRDGRASDTARE